LLSLDIYFVLGRNGLKRINIKQIYVANPHLHYEMAYHYVKIEVFFLNSNTVIKDYLFETNSETYDSRYV